MFKEKDKGYSGCSRVSLGLSCQKDSKSKTNFFGNLGYLKLCRSFDFRERVFYYNYS